MQSPLDIATASTVEFVQSHAKPGCSILEVGCGDGDVALALQTLGYDVIAVDSNEGAVARARQKSVNAHQARWPDFSSEHVDVVLFTRSLHHIDDLEQAVGAAHKHMHQDSLLMLEDFAFDDADESTCTWFMEKLLEEPLASAMTPPEKSFVRKVLDARRPSDAWIKDHGHGIHSIDVMTKAIKTRFADITETPAPYFYRYVIQTVSENEQAIELVDKFMREEVEAFRTDKIIPIGRRIVAGNRT